MSPANHKIYVKRTALLVSLIALAACGQQAHQVKDMQVSIYAMEKQLDSAYKPGLGEFMSGIQVHHAKLWFAGTNNNWKLADFEINEIRESLDDIQKYCTDRPEIKSIGMIDPVINSMDTAIKQQNPALFKSSYIVLTNTCNSCHKATAHEFNVIKIPDNPPFSNQDFKPAR